MTPASRTGADARAEMPELGAAESASLRKSFLEALTLIALLADAVSFYAARSSPSSGSQSR